MAHIHSVFDSNEHFVIDPVSRAITNSLSKKIVVMQYDHNSERFTFEIPKQVDGHNMTACDRVEIHYINIDAVDKSLKSSGVYEADDIQISPENNGVAVFSWLLSRNCTKYAGTLNFLIHFACTTDGVEDYAWNTAIFQSITIGNGMNNGAEVLEPFPDILAQWKAQLFSASETAVLNITTAETNALAAIEAAGEAKKQSVLDSIPDEYEALSALADQNRRNKAGAIVLDAEGESIVLSDASEYPLQNLKVFGRSTQDGTPTPDAPVDIVSVGESVVSVHGKNLLNLPQTISKDRAIYNYDLFTGTAGSSQPIPAEYLDKLPVLKAGVDYYFSYNIPEDVEGKKILIQVVSDDGETSINNLLIEEPGIVRVEEDTMITLRANSSEVYTIQDIQLEIGTKKTDYEPYTEQEITIPRTLPGIPVSSGGNYTDANGQQWICDEVDLKRGVYVQRNNKYTVNGGDAETWKISGLQQVEGATRFDMYIANYMPAGKQQCLSTQFPGNVVANQKSETCWCNGEGNINYFEFRICTARASTVDELRAMLKADPVEVVYALKTPIETALSDAENTAFKALHSNKPNTTILNDAGAFMAVEYVADTKTYIDNKIKQLTKGVTE